MMAPTLVYPTLTLFSTFTFFAGIEAGNGIYDNGLFKRDPAIASNTTAGYEYLGCYTDNVNSRALYQMATTSSNMTEEYCINYCSTNGYPYAGVEYSQECYCGDYITASGSETAESDCNMACSGNSTELCGGSSRLNIFHNASDVAKVEPVHNPGVDNWGYLGCFIDSVNNRTLPNNGAVNGEVTVAGCIAACQGEGYSYAGVEYAGQCYCADTLPESYLAPDGESGCNMVCQGNSSEYCGGPNRLDAYGEGKRSIFAPDWATLGCYNDSVQARTFANAVTVPGGADNMTIPNCQTACYAAGYMLAGVEYGQECWCDNSYHNGGGPASDGNAQCDMSCKGDPATVCGGPDRLDVYSYIGTSTSSSPTATATTGTNTASTTSASATPVPKIAAPKDLPANWTYSGCYIDNAHGRIFDAGFDQNNLTIESCVAGCQAQGYIIAGMEYSTQCFCGNSVVNGGQLASADSDCAMTCGGNSSEICGGPNLVSVYASANFTCYSPPVAKNTSLPGEWVYQGCLSDTPQPRVLPYQIEMTENLTISNCLGLCSEYGYSAASVEYGEQCYCGDDTDRINAGATWLTGGQCNTPCSGEPEALCGGSNAMNYYTWENLNIWGQAEGDDAGEYRFFVPGVVIPLITTVGINGKVLFTEKYGTGPPNSTGAYELDISLAGNFSEAWRALTGIKTDVFCSAGITLPDKVGRVLNIGGWSDVSTYGVRLYWPDGSPGQPSYNEWQENHDEVHLLNGRWYPGVLQLVNGSILVVGGENGSNGPPVPSIEVLPTPEGVTQSVYMDWLERTDPNNLYPFLVNLPSGGIGVFYYNEARILDETTFETVRTLPNIPGAVNNFLAGRTYPLEGTMMLMPQYYPYTDPLTVMICGGSTPYQNIALDNCVSIQPEVQGQNWTIERMPNQRVITCMTALPDGTYMILNGGELGRAGFGLGEDPNHMAVMYDPTKPLNQRFTRMANTTITRLYHSEAILLQDGRILVSGSDPEDPSYAPVIHPQEYRVEVFIPPYLMGDRGNTRPDFLFPANNTDFGFDEDFTIVVNSSVSKISLMGAVSSTHGNSFGQRTIFPNFSCSQGTAFNATNSTSSNSTMASNSTMTTRHLHTRQYTNTTQAGPYSNSTTSAANSTTSAYTNYCTITTPPNGHIAGAPGWFQVFVMDADGTPSVSKWVRIGGDPAELGNWPNFPDFDIPGM